MLHNDKETFRKYISSVALKTGYHPRIIEKDYFVCLFLKDIALRVPNIIFKGGTSLSKCHKLIKRFSEDIDLSLECEQRPTEGQRKKMTNTIRDLINEYGFVLKNPESIRSRRDFNRFVIDFDSIYDTQFVKNELYIETAIFIRTYPTEKMQVSSYIYDYLFETNETDIIEKYELQPFDINVQCLERTLVDKIFALCDYYVRGKYHEHSRHIYDIFKILDKITIDEKLKALFEEVKMDRKAHQTCVSAQDGFDIKKCFGELIEKDIYKNDFETLTYPLLFEEVDYNTIKKSLIKIYNSGLLD